MCLDNFLCLYSSGEKIWSLVCVFGGGHWEGTFTMSFCTSKGNNLKAENSSMEHYCNLLISKRKNLFSIA